MCQVLPIDQHSAPCGLHNAEEGAHKGGLAAASAPHYANLLPWLDAEAEAFQHQVQVIPIPYLHPPVRLKAEVPSQH